MNDAASLRAKPENGFLMVGAELWRRTKAPVREFVYWSFFCLSVVGLGGLGLWLELLKPAAVHGDGTFTALITFFPALIGSCCLQMAFEANSRRLLAFSLLCGTAAFVAALFLFNAAPQTTTIWCMAILACLVSLWIWWIANADNLALHDRPPIDAAVGGDPTAELGGGFDNFKT